ncbi:DUF6084 family protein [Mycolicibacterium confluentis]|uniref:Uncharacterized protein n=1 Tax=Mycolicibacterium confluentis TaxID=28047 RepID=A0A7I7XYU1_9MYCO|nr:DUF6084 family protein [Mycolicibacterium confluentis]MCV7319500.1 hypothetical protein [Mycolicibacterium confluentis]ORV34130.1 hypothetical protein AWB99_00275 [Mycolicibacterium confluentis]BBZ34520.1 hypothetical protein MCNF_31250 [Mycolicibacterium confluentis]
MSELTFSVLGVEPEPYAVTPTLAAHVGVAGASDDPVHAIALRCQVRIEPSRRSYADQEEPGLLDLFGPRERWAETQRTFLWQHTAAMVPGFSGAATTALPLPCTYDFEVAASKYLHALRDGTVPLQFLFSGTVFFKGDSGFRVQQVPWHCDDHYDMPVSVWRTLIATHFPDRGWVRLEHDTIAALASYKSQRGLLNLDDAVASLLTARAETP